MSVYRDFEDRLNDALGIYVCDTMSPDLIPSILARVRAHDIDATRVEVLRCEGAGGLFIRIHLQDGGTVDWPEQVRSER